MFVTKTRKPVSTGNVNNQAGTVVSELDDLIEQLKQKRDELRLQANLASKEIQDEWQELDDKMEDFLAKAKLGETGEGIGSALGQLGHELKQGIAKKMGPTRPISLSAMQAN
jgi:adenylosuccinate synthase